MSSLALQPPAPITAADIVEGFQSGEASLDEWLKKRALKNHLAGASRCFVIRAANLPQSELRPGAVIGYYTLSAGAICHELAVKKMRRNMPDPQPVILLGRLAIDRNYQNQGIGQALLRDAMLRAVTVAADTGVFAILVHALSESAKRFYLSRGFVASPLQPMTLLMTLETVRQILAEN